MRKASFISVLDITNGWFQEVCVLAHIFGKEELAKEVKMDFSQYVELIVVSEFCKTKNKK